MRDLYRRLGVQIHPGEEWKMALPFVTMLGTFLVIVLAGIEIGVDASLYVPMGVLIAVIFAGIPISYMSGRDSDED